MIPLVGVLFGTAVFALSSLSGSRIVEDNLAVPAPTHGCHGALPLAGGATRLPISVSRSGEAAAFFVQVCIDGKGSYPFLIDSGADSSVISQSLATTLHLAHAGPSTPASGIGCSTTSQPVHMTQWNVAELPLSPQTVYAQNLPGFGTPGNPYGLLGADVLSRFGAVRFDFASQTLTTAGPEQPTPTRPITINGPLPASPLPATLATANAYATLALHVIEGPGFAASLATLSFGPHAHPATFVLDTGSARTLGDTSVTSHLEALGESEPIATVCTTLNAQLVASGPWSAAGTLAAPGLTPPTHSSSSVPLVPLAVISTSFDTTEGPFTITGTLGADLLTRYRYATFDFAGGRLVLGPRAT